MTTAIALQPLTAEDLAALRDADSVVLSHRLGRGKIAAFREGRGRSETARDRRLYPNAGTLSGDDERTRDVYVDSFVYGCAEPGGKPRWDSVTDPDVDASHVILSARHNAQWRTLAGLLRRGDLLQLHWIADNNTEVLRYNDLHLDELRLHVRRGDREMVFHIDERVGPDNSARMVRRTQAR